MSGTTPGPWKVARISKPDVLGHVEGKGGGLVAVVWSGRARSLDVVEANAALIAAAPDMRDALEKAEADLRAVIDELHNYELNGSDAVEQIRGIYADLEEATKCAQELQARAEEAEAERDELRANVCTDCGSQVHVCCAIAERVEKAEAERDEARDLLACEEGESERMYASLDAAEAEATRLREALEKADKAALKKAGGVL